MQMLKVYRFRGFPEREKTGIVIRYGYRCNVSYKCDCAKKCKYHRKKDFAYYYTSAMIELRRFFEWKFHIKLPWLIFIGHNDYDMSGTTKCPFHKSRCYTCFHCKYSEYDNCECEQICVNENYQQATYEEANAFEDSDWHHQGRCKFFEKNEWADNYDRETGEHIY